MGETKCRLAPKGFTLEQWETFNEDGIIFIENTLSDSDIQMYRAAIDRVSQAPPKYEPGKYLGVDNIVEKDLGFSALGILRLQSGARATGGPAKYHRAARPADSYPEEVAAIPQKAIVLHRSLFVTRFHFHSFQVVRFAHGRF